MKYEINTLIASLVNKENIKKGDVGAIIAYKDNSYLVEIFTSEKKHLQAMFKENEIYKIDN